MKLGTLPLWLIPLVGLTPLLGSRLCAQTTSRAATDTAAADAFATVPGGFYLSVPGVVGDFRLFADGQWFERADGTAHLSALLELSNGLDRNLLLVLELSGRLAPGESGYPPPGSPLTLLSPNAYAPLGPVDPATFVYYTQATGSLTGLRAFDGLRASVAGVVAAQLGDGANNTNVAAGLAIDLAVTVTQPSSNAAFAPTGPAALRVDLLGHRAMCATHVDDLPQYSGNNARFAFVLRNVADDYLMLPRGTWTEAADGTATLVATLRRQSDYADAWELQLTCDQRVDSGDPAHPPPGSPVALLLPSIYLGQGGPIDPRAWRYYRQMSGTMTGIEHNAGGFVQLTEAASLQVGVGANQGNVFFGLAGTLAVTVVQQPSSHTISPSGDAMLRADLATTCILPTPQVLTGDAQAVDSVTQDRLLYTGIDLGFVEQTAIGPYVFANDPRRWFSGYVRAIDHETLELAIPQGLPTGAYPMRFLNATQLSNPLTVTIQAPAVRTLRTENDRVPGEPQHWVTHQGDLIGPVISLVVVSLSNVPSSIPGIVDLQIGNQFADYILVDIALHDPGTLVGVVTIPAVPATLVGMRLYAQAAMMDQTFFPLHASDVWFTEYP